MLCESQSSFNLFWTFLDFQFFLFVQPHEGWRRCSLALNDCNEISLRERLRYVKNDRQNDLSGQSYKMNFFLKISKFVLDSEMMCRVISGQVIEIRVFPY